MEKDFKARLQETLDAIIREHYGSQPSLPAVEVEIPKERQHGDLATNVAMKSARILRKSPLAIAQDLVPVLQDRIAQSPLKDHIARIEVKPPGFINFFLSASAISDKLTRILQEKDRYGSAQKGQGRSVQIEFVSANPTGPLSVAHARQAAVGDALGNIFRFLGYSVVKEYYVNDEGNQINLLGESVRRQAQQILLKQPATTEVAYQGEYIVALAAAFIEQNKVTADTDLSAPDWQDRIREFAVQRLLEVIRTELADFGVTFDVWAHQSKIADQKAVVRLLEDLRRKDYIYDYDGAQWFRSTPLGDDKDRVVKKRDGSYTYLAPDIVYHQDKYRRGFQTLINIWGPDHHGYIPRLKAAVAALGQDPESLHVLIVQLATIFRNGKPVSMSTRRGQYIQLREVMEEVGSDAARFFFLMRHLNAHLDFDLELAKKETPENPVYYIQYAHARIHSIYKKAREAELQMACRDFILLQEPEEEDLIKTLGHFPYILERCRQELDPYALVNYLMICATDFHRFYDRHRVVDAERPDLSAQRLALIEATRIVLSNGLTLLGISRPEQM